MTDEDVGLGKIRQHLNVGRVTVYLDDFRNGLGQLVVRGGGRARRAR
jgi:hypothetical protein